ncbi:MAG: MmgE/PrpD family protein [Betaproteobacteria bacterium]|nr:MmgE/PrpD family protein [Betaproteobacteria bacterium]
MAQHITTILAKFSAELTYEDLPPEVVHEAKRGFLDIVGCAVGSIDLDKGKIAAKVAHRIGGRPESTILGIGTKVGAPMAAFANGELMHSLDYCALLPPSHVAPFVTSAPLALAESEKASGEAVDHSFGHRP